MGPVVPTLDTTGTNLTCHFFNLLFFLLRECDILYFTWIVEICFFFLCFCDIFAEGVQNQLTAGNNLSEL